MSFNNYAAIADFGPGAGMLSGQSNPLSYCAVSGLESGFEHTLGSGTSLLGPNSSQCQLFMGQYCASNWDGVCEYLSQNKQTTFPNTVRPIFGPESSSSVLSPKVGNEFTQGDILVRNAAAEKYLKFMSSNCYREYEPFDPTVAASPLVSRWYPKNGYNQGTGMKVCAPIYDVDAKTIDMDPIMNKILAKPVIAGDILVNIYNNRMRHKTLQELNGTKLGMFFASSNFKGMVSSGAYN